MEVVAAVLNVFCNEEGQFGNPVALVDDVDGRLTPEIRQLIAAKTGLSETVFVQDYAVPDIRIYTPQQEIPFAGHAAVGAADHISRQGNRSITQLIGRDGNIDIQESDGIVWVSVNLKSTPPWMIERVASPRELEALDGPMDPSQGYTVLWSWIDQEKGIIRARTFALDWGIPEDEANGSGCMRLACTLGESLEVHHGRGSVVLARPSRPGHGQVGGRVVVADTMSVNLA